MRIYAIFENPEPPESLWQRLGESLTKSLTGIDPSLTCLIFVWAGPEGREKLFSSPYTDRIKIVVIRAGREHLGTWQEESVNLPRVYSEAFGKEPPGTFKIAVMNDSDNTGEESVSYVDFIELTR